jgi:hypothetical protein
VTWFENLTSASATGIEWLTMVRNDPGLLVSILETTNSLSEKGIIRIDESVIEKTVLDACKPLSGLSVSDLACCGLQSNRLLIYGNLKEKGLSYEFTAFIKPAKTSVVWTKEAQAVVLEVDGPRIQAANLSSDLLSSLTDFVWGMVIPGIAYEVIKKAFERVFESTARQRWVGSVAKDSVGVRKAAGNALIVDLRQSEKLRSLASQEVSIPHIGLNATVAELVRLEGLTIDRSGVGVKCALTHEKELGEYYSALLKQFGYTG